MVRVVNLLGLAIGIVAWVFLGGLEQLGDAVYDNNWMVVMEWAGYLFALLIGGFFVGQLLQGMFKL